jgi:hypothetical protein
MQSNFPQTLSPSAPQIIEVQDVVDKLDHLLLNVDEFYLHTSSNSLDQYYQQMIDNIVLDLTIIPVNQALLGLEPIDDVGSVNAGLLEMSGMLARFFNKTSSAVEQDVYNRMNTFPVDDIREARHLKHNNRLN